MMRKAKIVDVPGSPKPSPDDVIQCWCVPVENVSVFWPFKIWVRHVFATNGACPALPFEQNSPQFLFVS